MASPEDYRRRSGGRYSTAAADLDPGPLKQASPESENAPVQQGLFTRAYDAWSVPYVYLKQLAVNDDSILKREGQHDLALFNALLDDGTVFAAFQQRQLALISRPWEVEAGDDTPEAAEAAEHLRGQLNAIGWDRICFMMMFGRYYGYAVGELLFKIGPDGKVWIDEILVPDRTWFAFTNGGELRMRSPETPDGVPVPDNKFWAYRTGATHDFAPYGTGLAHWVYWPVWFKKNAIKFWALYLEKFGQPTVVGLLPAGTTDDDPKVDQMLEIAQAVGRDSAVVVNAGQDGKSPLAVLEASRSGSGASSYTDFCGEMNDEILRVILGQTMTAKAAAGGIGSNQSDTQKDVRDEIVASDSDMLHESFNRGPARWLTAWNFGDGVAPPRVYRNMEDQEDLTAVAERDSKLDAIGIQRTDASIKETYGDGYERKEVETPPVVPALPGGNVVDIADARRAKVAEFAAQGGETAYSPLYVSRAVAGKTAAKLTAWARSQGIDPVPASELHATVLYSKAAVDWFEMAGEGWDSEELRVQAGGPRFVERFGDDAIVLRFDSPVMRYRHAAMIEKGASSDYDYRPHITIGKGQPDLDLAAIEPFVDELQFGPEIFEPIKSDDDVPTMPVIAEFSADELADVATLADALAAEATPEFVAMGATLHAAVAGGTITSADQLRVVLLEAAEKLPLDKLAALSGLPMLAARAAAAAGVEESLRA